jgi:hypothetical protein
MTIRTEDIDCKWHIYLYQVSEADLSPEYSTKYLRLRRIIVQLITIKVIPNRLHGVYHHK